MTMQTETIQSNDVWIAQSGCANLFDNQVPYVAVLS